MTITRAARRAALDAIGGNVVLLSGNREIKDAGRLSAALGEPRTLAFGPATTDWDVTGFAVLGETGTRMLTGGIERRTVLEGQFFDLTIDVRISDD